MLIAAAFMLAVVGPSEAYEACRDSGRFYEECARVDRERLVLEIGAEPLDAMGGESVVRRAIFFDDYRRDLPMVEFRQDPGSSPRVIVSFDRLGHGVTRLEAPVSLEVWNEVLSEGRHFDRPLGPVPEPSSEHEDVPLQVPPHPSDVDDEVEEIICLHPNFAWVQAYDSELGIREAGGDTCDDDLAIDYAYRLAKLAGDMLAPCAVLELRNYGTWTNRLMACFALEGDALTAAEMMNDLEPTPLFDPEQRYREDILRRFAWDSDLHFEWAGQTIEGRDAATDWWIDRVSLPGAGVYELTHFGEAWNRVRSRAVFVLPNDPEECMYGPATQAPIEIDWRRSGDSWEIISLTVGAFSPLPDREEC